MARGSIEERLAQAEHHVEQARQHIARQQAIIAELEANGHIVIANQARSLLRASLTSQALHAKDRDLLRVELHLHTDL